MATFLHELLSSNQTMLAELDTLETGVAASAGDQKILLKAALSNEIQVADLICAWVPTSQEWDLKVAFAQQAGDEARHFEAIKRRLDAMGIGLSDFEIPSANPLFDYLRSLRSPAARIAAGMVTLESLAFRANEAFMRYCETTGDHATLDIYRGYIQPDELRHHEMGTFLLKKYAMKTKDQEDAKAAARRTLELAIEGRRNAVTKLGITCLPGC